MKKRRHIPPPLAERLLQRVLRDDLAEEVLGDLEEKFYATVEKKSARRAKLNYWYQAMNYLRPFAIRKSRLKNSNTQAMLQHYIKISWRSVSRQKAFSSIKIGGFAMGIAACLLIALFVRHELSYDTFYQDQGGIYRMTNQWKEGGEVGRWTNLQGPLKTVIEENVPEVDLVARTVLWSWGNAGSNLVRKTESNFNIDEDGFFYADPELLSFLEIKMVHGTRENALAEPNRMVISQTIADKYFSGENPVGRQMVLNDNPEDTYTVGGVMEDFPLNSHLQGDFILTLFGRKSGPGTSGWCCTNYVFYTKLKPGADPGATEQKLLQVRDTYVMDQLRTAGKAGLNEMQEHHSYYLQPIADVYLNSAEVNDNSQHGSLDLVWIFGAIAGIILLLACVNFVNLSTARSIQRAKEVGLRKVVGSVRSDLIVQYLSESVVFCTIAILLALIMATIALPFFNSLAGKSLDMPWFEWWFAPSLLALALTIGILSGLYPAIYLSKFNPSEVLRGVKGAGKNTSFMRSGMVVFQFAVTVILIISAIVCQEQFRLIMNKSLGYDKEQVINILGLNTLDSAKKVALKNELLSVPEVNFATVSDFLPVEGGATHNRNYWLAEERLLNNGFEAARWTVDEDYLDAFGMTLMEGQNFSGITSDRFNIIINESMAKQLALQEPVGAEVIDMFDEKYKVIGVVKDFYFESVLGTVEPLAMVYGTGNEVLSVSVKSADIKNTLTALGAVWEGFVPNQSFKYAFLNQRFEQMYGALTRARTLFMTFAVLSIVIACLGLFALSAYMVERRGKEVGIRKILGASVSGIAALLALDFMKLVLVAVFLAIPIGWLLMDAFLGDINNRVELSWGLFAIAGLSAIVIALATISIETLKAALTNPVEKLRSE
ncbi:MAG: ABC transporter permease [Imperialibacter sp.]|uniref:ABC transporter permease n=1 Tax=Imperialibacter sp. TaxID=2038411 RepID=UPI003A8BC69F